MLSKDILQQHYQEYAIQPDAWVNNMEATKKSIFTHVIKTIKFSSKKLKIRIAVLGASDKRYIPIHHRVFETVLKKKVEMVTLDVDRIHLDNRNDVLYHDTTKPFTKKYDIIFSHELMKFLTPNEQFLTIKNSYNALMKNGCAMHIIHEPSINGTKELRSWQYRVDPDMLLQNLKTARIPAHKMTFKSQSRVEWLRDTTVIIIEK